MKRAALLVGVIAVAAAAFFTLNGESKSESKPSPQPTAQVAAPRNAPIAIPRGVTAPTAAPANVAVERANVHGLPDELEPGYLAVDHAVRTCQRGRPPAKPIRPNGPDETIESIQLEYNQISSGGVGRVENVRVVDGKLTDEKLQACILKAAAAATWKSDAPDGLLGTLEQNVNVGDLLRPPHPSQTATVSLPPPPPELAAPLGKPAKAEDSHPDVLVAEPGLAKQPKK